MTQKDCTTLTDGDVRFYDNYVPTLGVGDFVLNFTQRFNPKTTPVIDETFGTSQVFSVQGPRYTLPTADIYSHFPPDNAFGRFDQFLPQVVFTKPDLPWERDLFGAKDKTADQRPWLALLLFVAGETLGGSSNPSLREPALDKWKPNRTKVASISASDFYTVPDSQTLTSTYQSETILWPSLTPEWYEKPDWLKSTMTTVIDVDAKALLILLPPWETLHYQAHARQVKATNKASEALRVSGDGWFSLMVGNRLPQPATTQERPRPLNIVHLVSLEGYEQYLGQNPTSLPAVDRIRMISFASWSFTCVPDGGQSFRKLMDNLLFNPDQTHKTTHFVIPYDPYGAGPSKPGVYTAEVLSNGYVPLQYETRLGERTFAWFRGPFSPVPTQNFISALQKRNSDHDWQPFGTASAALVYDKDYGLFNVSYAVAWETGRLLALSDGSFATHLLTWQRTAHQLIDLILTRAHQFQLVPTSFDPDNPEATVEEKILSTLDPYAWTDNFMTYLVTRFSDQIAPKLYNAEPAQPDPAFPAFPAAPAPVLNPTTINELMTNPGIQTYIRQAGGELLDGLIDWLAQRYVLMGVPSENLVPNPKLLPAESVRFFYLDSNWLDAMIEGALSIGIESSRDQLYQDLMKDLIWDKLHEAVQKVRDQALGNFAQQSDVNKVPFDHESMTGMLLNSAVVADWPGLQVTAYLQTKTNPDGEIIPDYDSEMNLLRLEHLGKNMMLALWPAVPALVTINEPHEGIAFGFENPPSGEGYYLYLRSLQEGDYGQRLCPDEDIEGGRCTHYIDAGQIIDEHNIVGMSILIAQIKEKLGVDTVNVRDLAVELIKVPESLDLIAEGATSV